MSPTAVPYQYRPALTIQCWPWYFIGYMNARTLIGELAGKAGETVTIQGWVDVRRDQGKLVFFDFRDRSGSVQGVVLPGVASDGDRQGAAQRIRRIRKRPGE